MVLVGYKTFFSKNRNTNYYVLNLEFPFRDGAGIGKEVYQQFVPEDVFKMVKPDMIGKEVEFDEERTGRFTNIVGISARLK